MRALILVGGLALGVLYLAYQIYSRREEQQREGNHQYGRGGLIDDDEEYIEIGNNENEEGNSRGEFRRRITSGQMPGTDELCPICQDHLLRRDATKKYCLISLPVCGHWFHQRCALRLLEYHPNCPVCRIDIDSTMLRNTPVRIATDASFVSGGDTSGHGNNNRTSSSS